MKYFSWGGDGMGLSQLIQKMYQRSVGMTAYPARGVFYTYHTRQL